MRYPVNTPFLNSAFGNRYRNGQVEFHSGWDLYSITGDTRVYPVISGIVTGVSTSSNAGYIITIQHEGNQLFYYSIYMHIVKPMVRIGQAVEESTVIGYYGKIGNSTGAHLHLEFRKVGDGDNTMVDPSNFYNGGIMSIPSAQTAQEQPAAQQQRTENIDPRTGIETTNRIMNNNTQNDPLEWIKKNWELPALALGGLLVLKMVMK